MSSAAARNGRRRFGWFRDMVFVCFGSFRGVRYVVVGHLGVFVRVVGVLAATWAMVVVDWAGGCTAHVCFRTVWLLAVVFLYVRALTAVDGV